jgi:hypothetical protein
LIGNFFLSAPPYLNISNGNGINPSIISPSKEFPQPNPSVAYIFGPAMGRKVAKVHLIKAKPAIAEAAYWPPSSI